MSNENKLFELMEKMYTDFSDRFDKIDEKFDSLEHEVKENRKSIKKLETKVDNEVSYKVGALFDAREVTNDKLDTIDEKIDKVQFDVNNLTMKVAQNDNTIIELKRNLKKVK